jgi:hypothetical protein
LDIHIPRERLQLEKNAVRTGFNPGKTAKKRIFSPEKTAASVLEKTAASVLEKTAALVLEKLPLQF